MKIFTQNSPQNGKNFDTRSVAKFVPFSYTTNCYKLSTIDLGDSISYIGDDCFTNCYLLQTVTLPSSCIELGISVFSNCISLQSCDMGNIEHISGIPNSFFYNCTEFTNITFPQHFSSIGVSSFAYTALKQLDLPECVEILDLSSFQGCDELVSFSIPENSYLSTIKGMAFSGCTSFKEILNADNTNFSIWNGGLFNKKQTEFIILPPRADVKYFSFPETVLTIGDSALEYCSNLEVIFIPSKVTTIKSRAFYQCTNLRFINIPSTVTTIENDVFEGCKRLQCDISVENQNEEFRTNLTEHSKLPQIALSPCIIKCSVCQTPSTCFTPLSLIFLILKQRH